MKYTRRTCPATSWPGSRGVPENHLRQDQGLERHRSGLSGLLQALIPRAPHPSASVRARHPALRRRRRQRRRRSRRRAGHDPRDRRRERRRQDDADAHPPRPRPAGRGRSCSTTARAVCGPADAAAAAIGMVHQEFMLVPELTLLENLVLGREPMPRGRIDRPRARAEAQDSGTRRRRRARLGRPRRARCTRQRLEILRLLYRERRRADPRRADRRARAATGRRAAALLRKLRDGGRTVDVHLAQARGGARARRPDTVMRGGRVTDDAGGRGRRRSGSSS